MKKLILVSMIVGTIITAGCAQKAVVQNEAPAQKPAPTAVEKKASCRTINWAGSSAGQYARKRAREYAAHATGTASQATGYSF